MNKDLNLVKRSVFTFWHALGEIGGLFGVVYGSFFILIQFANYNKAEDFIATQLYAGQNSSNRDLDHNKLALWERYRSLLPKMCRRETKSSMNMAFE